MQITTKQFLIFFWIIFGLSMCDIYSIYFLQQHNINIGLTINDMVFIAICSYVEIISIYFILRWKGKIKDDKSY